MTIQGSVTILVFKSGGKTSGREREREREGERERERERARATTESCARKP